MNSIFSDTEGNGLLKLHGLKNKNSSSNFNSSKGSISTAANRKNEIPLRVAPAILFPQ